jgi:hypothetical protein
MPIGSTVYIALFGPEKVPGVGAVVVRCDPLGGMQRTVRTWIVGLQLLGKVPARVAQPLPQKAA